MVLLFEITDNYVPKLLQVPLARPGADSGQRQLT